MPGASAVTASRRGAASAALTSITVIGSCLTPRFSRNADSASSVRRVRQAISDPLSLAAWPTVCDNAT